MAEGKRREAWDHTSHILAMLVNVNRDPKRGHAVSAAEMNPYLATDAKKSMRRISSARELAGFFGIKKKERKPKGE